uniref:WW domain-containing protein n=1 Tax=Hanusia phi TaxID=3032 RepID=A0A7S0E0P7_9CRYP
MSGEESLPPGWSKHWSNTWKKHYWFNSKTGEQSWEPPRLETPSEEPKAKETPHEDKPDESVKKKPKTDGSGTNPPKTKQPSQAKNANSKGGGGSALGALGSILGSIKNDQRSQSAAEIEAKRKRREAEEERRAEEKAQREQYILWVQNTLQSFQEGEEEYYEFPPSDSVHRLIVKDEAECVGLVAFSHGEKEEDKRVYVFKPGRAPNDLEGRYLRLGGTVQELIERRARGDTFKEYNTAFSLHDAKVVSKTKGKQKVDQADLEEEMEAKNVIQRDADRNAVMEAAMRIKESHRARQDAQ